MFVGTHGALLFLSGAAVDLVASAVAAAALLRSGSSSLMGMALSIAGSYGVVLVGGLIYGVWIIRR
ncbi:hypothetical protein AU186_15895 [Mycobacterium sp. GA-1999]|nr:hypothetical protein AU186_15895 [Mycobacterium sp. GA-1999]